MALIKRTCKCGAEFMAKTADVARGWAKSCSKSCAAIKREKVTGNFKAFCKLHDEAEQGEHNA